MTALNGLGQKIMEWAVIAALVGVVGYLIGNNDAMTMRAEIDRLRERETALEGRVERVEALAPRVERLDALNEARMENGK